MDPATGAQRACEYITVKDTTKEDAIKKAKPPPPKIVDSLFAGVN